jgi:hypothetical protein
MVKLFIALLTLGLSAIARGDDIPDPIAWWNQLTEAAWQDQPTVIRHLAVRSSQASKAKRWDKAMADFSGLGFFQYVPHEDVDFVKRLNPKEDLAEISHELLFDPELLQLVLLDRGTKMSVLANNQRNYKTIASWPIAAGDRKNAANMLDWLSRNLGYDAVVIDARDGMILAGLLKNTSVLGQGLLVKQSSKRWLIKESNTRGEALLQMMKTAGSLAVFEVLLAKGETLNVEKGSKILLGQNNNWMKMLQPETKPTKSRPAPAGSEPARKP